LCILISCRFIRGNRWSQNKSPYIGEWSNSLIVFKILHFFVLLYVKEKLIVLIKLWWQPCCKDLFYLRHHQHYQHYNSWRFLFASRKSLRSCWSPVVSLQELCIKWHKMALSFRWHMNKVFWTSTVTNSCKPKNGRLHRQIIYCFIISHGKDSKFWTYNAIFFNNFIHPAWVCLKLLEVNQWNGICLPVIFTSTHLKATSVNKRYS